MENDSVISFDDLVAYRRQLQRFCSAHFGSLVAFKDGVSFKLQQDEMALGSEARHLSSSATCLESLLACPDIFRPKSARDVPALAQEFAVSAIRRPHAEWLSDGSAPIYCRCRTLPLIVLHLPKYQDSVREHLEKILSQLKDDASRLAIGEASGETKEDWYPPNAFHTYWTLHLMRTVSDRFPVEFDQISTNFQSTRFDVRRLNHEMLLWAKQTAGHQIALHALKSSTLDSDQLAWSLATVINFGPDLQADLAQQDFIRQGLKCLFGQQTSAGIWRTGAPLFHYLNSGNAYCYIFETFSVLLRSVLTDRRGGFFLRETLRTYLSHLIELWRYARSTEIPLYHDGKLTGWSSGHRVNRSQPESWATASVYSFSQYLRRLIGIWTREEAAAQLRVSIGRRPEDDPVETLSQRGDTWESSSETAAEQLMTLFVNPTRFFGSANRLEPDSQPVEEHQARGAILFGPPGTSKTTLSSCVADAIGWDYVELHSSHFVAEGMPDVQRTANTIFERLLQLDRTVILFDEIDELVRVRGIEGDAFGRFLTTSMLPKLAELWKLRKVIYFVATNHISFFDPAVTRAQRFDAIVRVSPPSFARKREKILDLLKPCFGQISASDLSSSDVEAALHGAVEAVNKESTRTSSGESSSKQTLDDRQLPDLPDLPDRCVLAKLLLMRWDQLQELASLIRKDQAGKSNVTFNRELLESALTKLSDPSLKKCAPFKDYVDSEKYKQHDHSKARVWQVRGNVPDGCRAKLKKSPDTDTYWHVSKAPFGDLSDFPGNYSVVGPGVVSCQT